MRTIYRDFDTLVASGIPIEGERGVGYMLREPVHFPPMNLSLVELEALHLGMAIVAEAADAELQAGSASLTKKIAKAATANGTVPKSWGFGVYPFEQARVGFEFMPIIRKAIQTRNKLKVEYVSLENQTSARLVWPLQNAYWGRVWTMTAWCEARNAFRSFRVDRITGCEFAGAQFTDVPGRMLGDYLELVDAEMRQRELDG
ncbi:MAG: putative DNA-binding transcriptional regulator YafY [Ascidiaceihabitans sp.]